MKARHVVASLVGAALFALGVTPSAQTPLRSADTMTSAVDPASLERLLAMWPEAAQRAARVTIEKYGAPNEATASVLVWHRNGPWKRTLVHREEVNHDFPAPHKDVLEQVIDYRVSPDRLDELAAFDGSLTARRTKGELASRCDREEHNILALNLAADLASGRRSVQEARRFFTDATVALSQGQPWESAQRLLFAPGRSTADPDRPTVQRMAQPKRETRVP